MNKLYSLKMGYITMLIVLIVLATIKIVGWAFSAAVAILSFLTNVATVVVLGGLTVLALKFAWNKLVK